MVADQFDRPLDFARGKAQTCAYFLGHPRTHLHVMVEPDTLLD
jgi:hypothetical protein